jgi:signal transduction histidine kinase
MTINRIETNIESVYLDISNQLWSFEIERLIKRISFLEKSKEIKKAYVFDNVSETYIGAESDRIKKISLKKYQKSFWYTIKRKEIKYKNEKIGKLIVIINKQDIFLQLAKWVGFLGIILLLTLSIMRILIKKIIKVFDTQLKEIKEMQQHFYNIINSSPNPILALNHNKKIFAVNNSFKEKFVKDNENIKNLKVYKKIEKHIDEAMDKTKNVYLKEIQITNSYYSINIYPEHNIEEKDKLMIVQMVDITELKKVEKKYLRAQKMETVGLLTGGIAHDFNNILAGLFSYVELLETNIEKKKNIKYVKKIKRILNQTKDLVNQILLFSSENSTKKEVIALNHVIESAFSIAKHSISKNINLNYKKDTEEDLILYAEENILIQILLNLILNARDAIGDKQNGEIKIKTEKVYLNKEQKKDLGVDKTGAYVLLEIIDNGKGIPKEIGNKIFDPFFTTKNKDNKKGTGLGLAIVYERINNLGGAISVSSEVDEGTVFSLYIPLSKNKEKKEEKVKEKRENEGGKYKLLLIDDEEMIVESLKPLLERENFEVDVAFNGQEGLKKVGEKNFDLIILDWVMPKMDGKHFVEEINSKNSRTPILLSSGYIKENVEEIVEKYSFIKDIVFKPFDFDNLIDIIYSTLS